MSDADGADHPPITTFYPPDLSQTLTRILGGRQPMQTSSRAALEASARRVAEQLAELEASEREYGPEPAKNGAVIRFRRRTSAGQILVYSGIRSGDRWYLTGGSGRTPQRQTWEQLVYWMATPSAGLPGFTGPVKDFEVIHPGGRWPSRKRKVKETELREHEV